MLNHRIFRFKIFISTLLLMLILHGCDETSEVDKLRQYFAAINGAQNNAPSMVANPTAAATPALATGKGAETIQKNAVPAASLPTLGSGASTGSLGPSIVGGTPRTVSEGFCGDGIINGTTEDCDGNAIQNTKCSDYGLGFGFGTVTCGPDCYYNISNCVFKKTNDLIGGVTENCNCNCNTSVCKGGCEPTTLIGQSACQFNCDNGCTCLCEGKLQGKIQRCETRCACAVDTTGNPQCDCNLDDCEILSSFVPNIVSIATARTHR